MKQQAYFVRPAVFSPIILSAIAIAAACRGSWWWLAALPFIWLGSVCAQPNLNLADGCLAYLSILIGIAVAAFLKPLGIAIAAGAMVGLYLSAFEKYMRMRPVPTEQRK